jgi:hypothetical protein
LARAERYAASGTAEGAQSLIEDLRAEGYNDPALEQALAAGGERLAQVPQRVQTLREIRDASSESRVAQVDDRLRHILADPKFRVESGSPTVLDRVMRWFRDLWWKFWTGVDRLLRGIGKSFPGIGNVLYWFVVVAASAAAGAAIVSLAARLRLARSAAEPGGAALAAESYISATAGEWLDRAKMSAEKHDWRQAVRCLYMATLARLDDARLIRYELGITNWEYVSRVARAGTEKLCSPLRGLTARFDHVWYGGAETGESEYKASDTGYRAVVSALEERPA